MSGHSKWENIKRKKAVVDAKRGKEFTKLSRNITVAAKQGGVDPDSNASLRLAIQKAKEANMPKDKIAKAIKKAKGGAEGLEEITYEFYGPGGVACIVSCTTDNKNRTHSDVRLVLSNNNTELANPGSASYIFSGGVPSFTVKLSSEDQAKLDKIIEELKEIDEFDEVKSNAE